MVPEVKHTSGPRLRLGRGFDKAYGVFDKSLDP